MNALNSASPTSESSTSSDDSNNVPISHHDRLSNGHNNCNSQLSNGTPSNVSVPYGGARPKTKEFDGNVPNGVASLHKSTQSHGLNDPQDIRCSESDPLSSELCSNQNRLSGESLQAVPCASQQNRESQAGPSHSNLFRYYDDDDDNDDDDETDASGLAAVCAASSRRAMAERARLAEHGKVKRRCSPVVSDSSSDTGNDDGLSGDECCIYTYKGDQNAELSSGLLGLTLPQANDHPPPHHPPNGANRDGGSSPEMDFLEMDFDPDPLGEQDSIDEDNVPEDLLERQDTVSPALSAEEVPNELGAVALSPHHSSSEEEGAGALLESSESSNEEMIDMEPEPFHVINVGASTSADSVKNLVVLKPQSSSSRDILRGQHIAGSQLCPVEISESQKLSFISTVKTWHTNTEPVLDKQKFNLYSALYHSIMANNLILDEEEQECAVKIADDEEGAVGGEIGVEGEGSSKIDVLIESCPQKQKVRQHSENELPDLEKTMIWTEREACHKQVSQIAVSACGAAAVSNVLYALGIPFTLESVHEGVATRLRAEKACLPTYLFSRSAAGAAHNDLIRGLDFASDGAVYSRFFHMYPERDFSLSRWIANWIKEGAVPIAILNIQKSVIQGATIPDSWHHQMIFGVSQRGIYLTNPLECVSEEVLLPQLSSPSELLVRRQDIVTRWKTNVDLSRLATVPDIRWKQMNVLGQVVNIMRETNSRPHNYLFRRNFTSHISIPASYCSGILLSVAKDNASITKLQSASELPLKDV